MNANRAILESAHALFQRQTEMLKQVLEKASEAVKSLGSSAMELETADKQIKMIDASVSNAMASFSEVVDIVKR